MPVARELVEKMKLAPAPLRGAAWMLLAALGFAAMTALVRLLSMTLDPLHPFEIAFWRNLYGLLFMAPWIARVGFVALKTRRVGGYTIRAVCGVSAMLLWFWAIALMPLGEAVALSFTAPLFASVAVVLILGERMGLRRTLALLAGFAGTLVILRPGLTVMSEPALLVLASSVFIAFSVTMVKTLARSESPAAIVTWMGVYMTPLSLVPAAFVWRGPGLAETALLIAIGGLATLGQVAMTRAFAATEATIVLPFDYARLPFAAAIAYVLFAETPDARTWIGAAIIAGATVYMARREAQLAKFAAFAPPGAVVLGAGGAEATALPATTGSAPPRPPGAVP